MTYGYKPLDTFVYAIQQFINENYDDSHSQVLIKTAKKILNFYLTGKPVPNDIISNLKILCRGKRTATTRILNNVIKHIDISHIVSECLEYLVLYNMSDKLGLIIESDVQWDFMYSLIQKRELNDFIVPISKRDIREKYFDFPVMTFLPASWIPELIILPPSERFFLITPSFRKSVSADSLFFKAPNNSSLEISNNQIKTIYHKMMQLNGTDEYRKEFVETSLPNNAPASGLNLQDFDIDELGKDDKYKYSIRLLDLVDVNGSDIYLESNKSYICISKKGDVGFKTFENEYQFNNIDYVVNNIDATLITEAEFKRAQNSIMEKWKQVLRNSISNPALSIKLRGFGATRANPQNIRNWADPDRIAPANNDDFRAVLKFSGITNEADIRRYFTLAREKRSESISLGHRKSILAQEIIRDFLIEKVGENSLLEKEYTIHGIKINITKLDNK